MTADPCLCPDPATLATHVQAEMAKWAPVVEQANVQMD